jgi:hypothetical protein
LKLAGLGAKFPFFNYTSKSNNIAYIVGIYSFKLGAVPVKHGFVSYAEVH